MNTKAILSVVLMGFIAISTSAGRFAHATTNCWPTGERVCTDGPSTKNINGTPITRDCWNYRQEYQCGVQPAVDNCQTVRDTSGCMMASQTCVNRQPDGTCLEYQYRFDCYVEGQQTTQQVCGGDVFCVDGSCGAGTTGNPNNFGQAYGTFTAAKEAAQSFDATTGRVFGGSAQQCRKALQGSFDCCGNDGIISDITGCNQEEISLADANRPVSRTHYIGRYCSVQIGCPLACYCVEHKWSYCTFGSVIARIVQEQGRPQIGKGWGSPQNPDCSGFTLAEFGGLDFAAIDFSEYIATVSVPAPNQAGALGQAQQNLNNQQSPY